MGCPVSETEHKTRQNMKKTRVTVALAFATTTGANFFLIGYLARFGGLDLVGIWSLYGAIILNVLILDFGLTSALTYQIAHQGLAEVLPVLRWVVRRAGLLILLLALAATLFGFTGNWHLFGWTLAIIAGFFTLVSSWLITIRMGQHEQYWFNGKTVLRVLGQSLAIVYLLSFTNGSPEIKIAVSLIFGAMLELVLSYVLVAGQLPLRGTVARLSDIKRSTRGFGLESFANRAYQPFAQFAVTAFEGAAAVGVFTVALRIPVAINQAITEALRALLPGLAELQAKGERIAVTRLLRDAIATQVVLILPIVVFLMFAADWITQVWLGQTQPMLTLAMQVFTANIAIFSLNTPFNWAVQAAGGIMAVGVLSAVRLVAVLVIGIVWSLAGGGVMAFVIAFAIGQSLYALTVTWVGHSRYDLVMPGLRGLNVIRSVLYMSASIALNAGLFGLLSDQAPEVALAVVLASNAIVFGPLSFFVIKKKALIKCPAQK